MIRPLLQVLLPLSLLPLGACAAQEGRAPVRPVEAPGPGMVSAADPRAAMAGREILRAGGSAADAAIATAIALTVVEPQSSGIGGGGFLVHHSATGGVTSYDGRETAPAAAGPDLFLGDDGAPLARSEAVPGGKSVGVPGNIRMFALAHQRHGRLAWAELFAPAIRLAREGFALTPRMRTALVNARHVEMSEFVRRTYHDDDAVKSVGALIRNPELADLLERIATEGPDHFYEGPPAAALVAAVRGTARNPSAMTQADVAGYQAKERPPLCGDYRGHRVCGMGPPSSGGTTVFAILKQLERFDLSALGPDDPAAWHLIAESMRLAYADREAYLGDSDFVSVPVAGLMDADYLAGRGALIRPDRAMESVVAGMPPGAVSMASVAFREAPSTSHMVAADGEGNVASLTSTIEGPWGSGLAVDGYFLNNELTDFNFVAQAGGRPVANRVEGGKRPRSSMAPSIVYGPDGSVRLAIGAAGGVTIIAQVAKAIIGVVDWGLPVDEAIALPQLVAMGERVSVERGTALEAMIPALEAYGHEAAATAPGFKANGIERTEAGWRGGADPRSEGVALPE